MKALAGVGFLLGLSLFTGLLAYQGAGEVLSAVVLAGWGLFAVAGAHLAVTVANAAGWRMLLEPALVRPMRRMAYFWWIGDGVNALLPVAQVGGEMVRARLLARSGVPGAKAGAAVVVSLTGSVLTLLVTGAAGGALLTGRLRAAQAAAPGPLFFGLAAFAALLAGFYAAQRGGLFSKLALGIRRLAGGREWLGLVGGAEALDSAIGRTYAARRGFFLCCAWQLAARLAGAAEVWLALRVLGHPVDFSVAFIVESLAQVIKSAGFFIPGALGVQEAGFFFLGSLVGLPGEVALGLSLVKRVRDLILGLPALAVWQAGEGRRLFTGRSGGR